MQDKRAMRPRIEMGFARRQEIFLVEAALTRAGYDTADPRLLEALLVLVAMGAASQIHKRFAMSREELTELTGEAYDAAKAIQANERQL